MADEHMSGGAGESSSGHESLEAAMTRVAEETLARSLHNQPYLEAFAERTFGRHKRHFLQEIASDPTASAELAGALGISAKEEQFGMPGLPEVPTFEFTTPKEKSLRKELVWPKWSGRASEYLEFRWRIIWKLKQDGPRGLTDAEAAWYGIHDCLPAKQRAVTRVFLTTGGYDGDFDPAKMIRHLDHCFGSVIDAEKGMEDLSQTRQANGQTFGEFLPLFEDALGRAGGNEWDERARQNALRTAMSPWLKAKLATVELPTNYPALQRKIQQVAWRVENSEEFRRLPRSGRQAPHAGRNTPATTPFFHSGGTRGAAQTSGVARDGDGDVIMNVAATGGPRRAAWSTQGERDRRRREGLCLNCGGSGHYLRECPYGRSKRPRQGEGAARVNNTRAEVAPVLEPEEGMDEGEAGNA